jgi:S1-C subfamily serine protease
VVTRVQPGGAAADSGIQPGDVIQEVNREAVSSVEDLRQAVRSAGEQPLVLLVNRQGQTSYLVIERR